MNCTRWWSILTSMAAGAGIALAQAPANEPVSGATQGAYLGAPQCLDNAPAAPCHRAWLSTEYLLWSLRDAPSPFPLVTSGSLADAIPGALGEPGTRVLFGGSGLDYHATSGLRISGGWWLTAGNELGIEASGFALERRSSGFAAQSDAAGNPLLARPVFNPLENAQNSIIDSVPNVVAGGVSAASSIRVWGWEANLASQWRHTDGRSADLFVGFRSLDLRETLRITDNLTPLAGNTLTFEGNFVDVGSQISDFDVFDTHNRFYGGQVGGRMEWQRGLLSVGLLGKVALGGTRHVTSIDGGSQLVTPGGATTSATGGVLAQSTNIGRHSDSEFSVVPELGLRAALQLTPRLRVRVGYTYLYWSNVVRPGDQIDPTVNPRLIPTSQDFANPAGAPTRPAFTSRSNDFSAHGVDFGVELRY